MSKEVIFIHIPKTGGTTINSAMQGSHWQTEPDFNYRHIEVGNKKSNSGDIFEARNTEKYQDYSIFMMLRNPIDRVISEYHFIKERSEFIDLLKTKPKDFKSYISALQTNNGVVSFLVGRRMYDPKLATQADLDKVIAAIDTLPIHVGIFEEFDRSLTFFTEKTGITWNKKIEVKRMTFVRPKVQEIEPEIKALIEKHNALDIALYNYCLAKFQKEASNVSSGQIDFVSDKINHIIPYAQKFCFYEFCMENKGFIKAHFEFFRRLNLFLLNGLRLKKGEDFAQLWNRAFIAALQHHFPDSGLVKRVEDAYSLEKDSLQATADVAKAVDTYLAEDAVEAKKLMVPMQFQESFVPFLKGKGLFKRIFGK